MRGRCEYLNNLRQHVPLPPSGNSRPDTVAREPAISQDNHPADARDPTTLVTPVINGQVGQIANPRHLWWRF